MTYKVKSNRRRGATPAAVVTGTTRYEDINIANNYTPLLAVVNGINQGIYNSPIMWAQMTMHVTPSRIAELMARQFIYNQYRILSVVWYLKRGDMALQATGPIRSSYLYGNYACLMPNAHNETFPTVGLTTPTDKLLQWMIQNGGKQVKIGDRFAKLSVPATVIKNVSYEEPQTGGEVEHSTYEKMPWLELNAAKMNQMSIGQAVFVQPPIETSTFYTVHASNSDQGGNPGQTYASLANQYKYEVFAKVKWQVRGKYIDPGVVISNQADVETFTSHVPMNDLRISDV